MCLPTILKSSSSPKYHPKTNPKLPIDITPWRIRPFGDDGHHRASADTGANEGRNSCRRLRSLLCEPWLRRIPLLRRGCPLHCCVSAIQGRPHYRFVWGYGSRGCVYESTTFFFFSIQKQICLSPSVFSPFFLNILLLETKVSFWFSFRKNKKIFPNVEKSRKINAFLPFTKKYSTEFQLWHTSCSYIGQKEKNKTTCPKQKRKAAVFGKGNPPPSGKSLRNQGKLRLFTDLLWTKINIFSEK